MTQTECRHNDPAGAEVTQLRTELMKEHARYIRANVPIEAANGEGDWFRRSAASLRGDVIAHVNRVFDWIDQGLDTGEGVGAYAGLGLVGDMLDGCALTDLIGDLMRSADRWMPCPRPEEPGCRCGFCKYGRCQDAPHGLVVAHQAGDGPARERSRTG